MTDKIRKEAFEFLKKNPSSILSTVDGTKPVSRPMWAIKFDDDFTVWYSTAKSSKKMKQISKNSSVCLTFSSDQKMAYIRIFGKAKEITDKKTKDAMWNDEWGQYYKGKDDPQYTLLKIKPSKVEYTNFPKYGWETKRVI
jgi:general stress protein 26